VHMAIHRHKDRPADETLERVRFIVVFRARNAPPKTATTETNPLSESMYALMMSRLDELGIAVQYRKGRGLFEKKDELHYRVGEHKDVRLEFVDRLTIGAIDGPRELVSIGRYVAGSWEDRLKTAYDECLRLTVQMDEIGAIEDRLVESSNPEDVVAIVDALPDRDTTLGMLFLGPKRSSNAYTLYMSYILVDRVQDAHAIIEKAVELNPNDARLHLSLGNFYWAALCNAKGWAAGRDPGPLSVVTLDSMDMTYEKARSLARTHYLEAMRLSTHREIEEEAGSQLSTLRS